VTVIVMTKYPGKATNLEALLDEHGQTLQELSQRARNQGCMHHMFVEDTDGDVLVIDEWDSRESFDAFIAAQQDDIQPIAAAGGVTGPPTATTYRIIDTPDRF
jgi:quinol monooxygenase YgiN